MLICISGVGAAKRLWIGEPTPELSALGENGLMAVGSGHDSADYGLAIDQGVACSGPVGSQFSNLPCPSPCVLLQLFHPPLQYKLCASHYNVQYSDKWTLTPERCNNRAILRFYLKLWSVLIDVWAC